MKAFEFKNTTELTFVRKEEFLHQITSLPNFAEVCARLDNPLGFNFQGVPLDSFLKIEFYDGSFDYLSIVSTNSYNGSLHYVGRFKDGFEDFISILHYHNLNIFKDFLQYVSSDNWNDLSLEKLLELSSKAFDNEFTKKAILSKLSFKNATLKPKED